LNCMFCLMFGDRTNWLNKRRGSEDTEHHLQILHTWVHVEKKYCRS
jgi:hypothetical protein